MNKGLIILSLLIAFTLVLSTALAETNITLLYGWNGTTWVPLKTSADGTLQTDLNITSAIDIFPKADNAYDLGTAASRWRTLYLGTRLGVGLTTSPISTIDVSGNLSVAGSTNSSIDGSTFFVDATNNRIGIGTTTPASALQVVGSTTFNGITYTWPSADGSSGQFLSTNGAGTLSWSSVASGWTVSGSTLYNNTAGVQVGIGTSTPSSTLHVSGANTAGNNALLNVSNGTTNSVLFVNGTSGNVGIGTTSPAGTLDVAYLALDSYTKLLLHADGSGASFTDSSSTAKSLTANGNVIQSSTQYKFGGKSAYFDATSDNIVTGDSTDFNLAGIDYTIDFWLYRATDVTTQRAVFAQEEGDNYPAHFFEVLSSQFRWVIRIATGGNHDVFDMYSTGVTPSINTWYHVALVKNGTTYKMYIDGLERGSTTNVGDVPENIAADFELGSRLSAEWWDGYIDEFRVSNGVARWTANFTVPSSAYSGTVTTSGALTSTSNGNVGIGTSNPQQKLDVVGNINTTGLINASGSGNNYFGGTIYGNKVQAFPWQYKFAERTSDLVVSPANEWENATSVSLEAGTWLILAQVLISETSGNSLNARIWDDDGSGIAVWAAAGQTATSVSYKATIPLNAVVYPTSTTNYFLQATSDGTAATIHGALTNPAPGDNNVTFIRAFRIG